MVGAFFPVRILCLPYDDRFSCSFACDALLSSGGMRALSCPSGRARAPRAEPTPRAAEKDSDEAGAKQAQDATHAEGEREEATQSEAD